MNQLRFVTLVGIGVLLAAPALWAEAPSSAPSAASPPSPSRRPIDPQRERLRDRHERRERHRAALLRELGQRLSDPQVEQELKLHATRIAELSRIQFLAENTRSGPQREKLLARVTKLLARESERHRLRLVALGASSAAPTASASAGPGPTARASSGAPR